MKKRCDTAAQLRPVKPYNFVNFSYYKFKFEHASSWLTEPSICSSKRILGKSTHSLTLTGLGTSLILLMIFSVVRISDTTWLRIRNIKIILNSALQRKRKDSAFNFRKLWQCSLLGETHTNNSKPLPIGGP